MMPFRKGRSDNDDRLIDFDAIYAHLIEPAVYDAGLRPHRADEEQLGGIFHKNMFERLWLCEFAVADLSLANPNVFYELGVRHALRPWSTALIFRSDAQLPLDVALDSALPYPPDVVDRPQELQRLRAALTRRLVTAQDRITDSPIHQLVAGLPVPDLDHRRVDLVLEAIDREADLNRRIEAAADGGLERLRDLRAELGDISNHQSESMVALLLAFRRLNGFAEMAELVEHMPTALAEVWLVQEQYAMALGRLHRFRKAGEILRALVKRRPNAETYGLLGGVYRREWEAAVAEAKGENVTRSLLRQALEAYRTGFDVDLRDPYPGINALLLMRSSGREDELARLLPIVQYCVDRRLEDDNPEYWDYVCGLQLAVLRKDRTGADRLLDSVLSELPDQFAARTTANGLASMADDIDDPDLRDHVRQMSDDLVARGADL